MSYSWWRSEKPCIYEGVEWELNPQLEIKLSPSELGISLSLRGAWKKKKTSVYQGKLRSVFSQTALFFKNGMDHTQVVWISDLNGGGQSQHVWCQGNKCDALEAVCRFCEGAKTWRRLWECCTCSGVRFHPKKCFFQSLKGRRSSNDPDYWDLHSCKIMKELKKMYSQAEKQLKTGRMARGDRNTPHCTLSPSRSVNPAVVITIMT